MIDYIVSVINSFNEEMTFRFRELHDAITMYSVAKHDLSVTFISVNSVEYDENNPEKFTDGQTIRVYEKE